MYSQSLQLGTAKIPSQHQNHSPHSIIQIIVQTATHKFRTAVPRHPALKNKLDHPSQKHGRVQQALKQTESHGRACLVNTFRTVENALFAHFVQVTIPQNRTSHKWNFLVKSKQGV